MRNGRMLICLSAAALAALAVTSAPASGNLASSGDAAASATQSAARTVRLVTGDLVRVSMRGGRQTAEVVKGQQTGPGSAFSSFFKGGDLYVVPASAAPFLRSTLDLGLFDVSRLVRHPEQSMSATVHLRSGGSAAQLPGFRSQSRSGLAVHGSFAGSAFGAALAAQAMRDHASPTHTTGLFQGIARIEPATVQAPGPVARPSSTDSVLTIKGTDYNGNPDNGDAMTIYNVDDLTIYSNFVSFQNGSAQLTDVPDGRYSGVAFFYDFTNGAIYEVTLVTFVVKGDTTVSVDARDATSHVTITTPKPSVPVQTEMEAARADANGQIGSYSFLASTEDFYVKPIAKHPSVGHLYYFVYQRAFSSSAKQPSTYDLKYGTKDRIASNQTYRPAARSLAAIDSAYFADHQAQGSLDGRFGAFPWEQFLITGDIQFTTPTRRTEYYTASNDLFWEAFDYQSFVTDPCCAFIGEIDASWRSFESGWTAYEPWGDDPSHPRWVEHNIYPRQVACPACLTGSTLDALAFPFADNSWQHRAYPDQPTTGLTESADWDITADGNVVRQGTGVLIGSADVSGASTYGFDYDTTRSGAGFSLSTETHSNWTVPADAPQSDLPSGWTCSVDGGTDCTVLPLMTANYSLPVNLLGELSSGNAVGSLRLGHLAHADVAPDSLQVKVSYDGGSTYQNVNVSDQGNGKFTLKFTVPSPGQTDGYGALKISATDANGATLDESILRAFAVVG